MELQKPPRCISCDGDGGVSVSGIGVVLSPWGTLTWATILVTSPGLEGSRIVLESLASLENALTYCSATVSEAAASPFCSHRREKKKTQITDSDKGLGTEGT